MKITLILPNISISKNKSAWYRKGYLMAYAPTTLTLLAALVPEELKAEIEIIDEGVQELNPEKIKADIVGINLITANALHAYNIAKVLRKKKITVVFGGAHATLMPEEAKKYADAVVIGYAEETWPQLLIDFKNNELKKEYREIYPSSTIKPGVFSRDDLLKKNKYILPNTLEATKGCVNNCSFCVIPKMCNGIYRKRPVEDVLNEIQTKKMKRVVFLDSNSMGNPTFAKKLISGLADLKVEWLANATIKQARDPEWVSLVSKSYCRGVMIGFESLNQKALKYSNKGFNKVNIYPEIVTNLHDKGIFILGSFMFGFEDDDPSVFEKTVDFINQHNIDLAHMAIYTPFPGTPHFKKLESEKRILTKDWSLYDCKKAVFQPNLMSVEELQDGFIHAYETVHSYSSIIKRSFSSNCDIFNGIIANLSFRNHGKTLKREIKETRNI